MDAELVRGFSLLDPSVIGRDYFVFGTLGIKTFNASMKGTSIDLKALRANAADFKSHLDFVYDPGGFRRDDADPATYLRNASEASKTRKTAWTTRRVVGSDSAEH